MSRRHHAVLHTHERNLDYHPHVHLIVPAGAIDQRSRQWRQKPKGDKVLFWATNLSRVFRAKWFEAMRVAGLRCQEPLPDAWLLLPHERAVEVWGPAHQEARNQEASQAGPRRLDHAATLEGGAEFPGLCLNLEEIWTG